MALFLVRESRIDGLKKVASKDLELCIDGIEPLVGELHRRAERLDRLLVVRKGLYRLGAEGASQFSPCGFLSRCADVVMMQDLQKAIQTTRDGQTGQNRECDDEQADRNADDVAGASVPRKAIDHRAAVNVHHAGRCRFACRCGNCCS